MGRINIDELTKSRIEIAYPNIEIEHVNQTLAVVVGYLESGDTPLLVHNNGSIYIVSNVSNSPINMLYLLETSSGIYYNVDESNRFEIKDVLEYMDLLLGGIYEDNV